MLYKEVIGLQSSVTLAKHCGKECKQTSSGLDNEAKPAPYMSCLIAFLGRAAANRWGPPIPMTTGKSPLNHCCSYQMTRIENQNYYTSTLISKICSFARSLPWQRVIAARKSLPCPEWGRRQPECSCQWRWRHRRATVTWALRWCRRWS